MTIGRVEEICVEDYREEDGGAGALVPSARISGARDNDGPPDIVAEGRGRRADNVTELRVSGEDPGDAPSSEESAETSNASAHADSAAPALWEECLRIMQSPAFISCKLLQGRDDKWLQRLRELECERVRRLETSFGAAVHRRRSEDDFLANALRSPRRAGGGYDPSCNHESAHEEDQGLGDNSARDCAKKVRPRRARRTKGKRRR